MIQAAQCTVRCMRVIRIADEKRRCLPSKIAALRIAKYAFHATRCRASFAKSKEKPKLIKPRNRKSRGFLLQNFLGWFQKLTVLQAGHTCLFIGSGSHFVSWPRMERPQFCPLGSLVTQKLERPL